MTNATKPPNKKLLGFPGSRYSVETKLLSWVRGIVQSNDELVRGLECLRDSYKALLAGQSVTDAAEILWQVEVALSDAKRSRNAPELKSSEGPGRA